MPSEREIIADEIERMMKSMSLLNDDDLRRATHEMGRLVYVHSSQVIAALRAKDREDGAREMRERAAEACRKEAGPPALLSDDLGQQYRAACHDCATEIAALPLTPKESGDA